MVAGGLVLTVLTWFYGPLVIDQALAGLHWAFQGARLLLQQNGAVSGAAVKRWLHRRRTPRTRPDRATRRRTYYRYRNPIRRAHRSAVLNGFLERMAQERARDGTSYEATPASRLSSSQEDFRNAMREILSELHQGRLTADLSPKPQADATMTADAST
jgi:hypothetical protein